MAVCVRRFCTIAAGRRGGADGENALLADEDGAAAARAAARAARRGLKQVSSIRRQCDALLPILEVALAVAASGSVGGQVTLATIRARLDELAELLQEAFAEASTAGAQAARPGPACRGGAEVREVAHCICATGAGPCSWHHGRVVLSDSGLAFEDAGGGQGGLQLVLWADVARLETRDPSQRSGSGANDCLGSHMYEADLELKRPPGRLRLQFGAGQPVRSLDSLWRAASDASSRGTSDASLGVPRPPVAVPGLAPPDPLAEAWAPILARFHGNGCRPTCEVREVCRLEVSGPQAAGEPCAEAVTLAQVHEQLLRTDADAAVSRFWQLRSAAEMVASEWGSLDDASVRYLSFQLPLKPQPMAPKSTRMSLIYHLGACNGAGPLTFTMLNKALDVPYGDGFTVLAQYVFSEDGAGGVAAAAQVGIAWSGRCMIKGIIESATRSETADNAKDLIQELRNALSSRPRS